MRAETIRRNSVEAPENIHAASCTGLNRKHQLNCEEEKDSNRARLLKQAIRVFDRLEFLVIAAREKVSLCRIHGSVWRDTDEGAASGAEFGARA